jgi:hypothetical protein
MATTTVVRVPGDYLIQAKTGGVVIDVTNTTTNHSATPGTLSIYGNLNVFGTQTFIETTNTNITDNILVLNGGETNDYVSAGTAGIAISRSNNVENLTNSASFLFDDTKTWSYDNVTTYQGLWKLAVGTTSTTALTVNALRINPAVNFLNFLGKEIPLAVLNV